MRNRIEGKLLLVPIMALALLVFWGCVPYKKQVYFQYLEEMAKNEDGSVAEFEQIRTEYKLQVDDVIDIQINSPNSEAAAFFSKSFTSGSDLNGQMMRAGGGSGDIYYLTGYIVNDSGFIELPIIGDLPVAGLSIREVKNRLENELLKYFNSKNSFYITVKLGGIRYSIHGEVMRPGRYVVLESRYNIYQALAQVGDLTAFANRSEVWLLRQESEKTKIYAVDLLSKEIMESPLFYIQPNDVIFVRPLKAKQYGVGSTFLQNFNSTVSVLSATISLYLSYRLITR